MKTSLARVVACFVGLLLAAGALALVPQQAVSAAVLVDRDCGDFKTQAAAQNFFLNAGGPKKDPHRLDADGDGVACETRPCPCSSAKGSTSGNGAKGTPTNTKGSKGSKGKVVRQNVRVIAVVDGDTVDVRFPSGARKRVRLLGINTPEMKPLQCGAQSATTSARKLLPKNTRVLLVSDPSQGNSDRYGRLLRYVMKGKQDISKVQLLRGWAKVYVVGKNFQRVNPYRTAQKVAKNKNRGVWRSCR